MAMVDTTYGSLHYPVKCITAGFTKRSYRTKERMWTFNIDHVTRNNRRKIFSTDLIQQNPSAITSIVPGKINCAVWVYL